MYEQTLVKVVEPIKKTTITRLNRGKKWKYGYNKINDQHVFYLNEKPLGKLNQNQLSFYFK